MKNILFIIVALAIASAFGCASLPGRAPSSANYGNAFCQLDYMKGTDPTRSGGEIVKKWPIDPDELQAKSELTFSTMENNVEAKVIVKRFVLNGQEGISATPSFSWEGHRVVGNGILPEFIRTGIPLLTFYEKNYLLTIYCGRGD